MSFKPSMTVEEYLDNIRSLFKKWDYPQEYIDSVEQDARNQYEHDIVSSEQLGTNMINPGAFFSTCWMLYPDKPDVPPVRNAFNFDFQGVREKSQ